VKHKIRKKSSRKPCYYKGSLCKIRRWTSEAPYEILKKIAQYYQISIDLSVDVRKIEVGDLLKLENNRLILPIQVDQMGENRIEVVTQK
jgi:hypothetical protein